MILTYFWCVCVILSAIGAIIMGRGNDFATEMLHGASSAVTTAITIAGPLSLWSGLGNLMTDLGIINVLSNVFSPLLHRIFPSAARDTQLSDYLCANFCANLLGLGNAATPMGIQAVRRMEKHSKPGTASDEMCRLVVMNTASIQLIPTTVAAVRAGAGAKHPMDILPCVWISSILSVTAGLGAAMLLRRFWKDA